MIVPTFTDKEILEELMEDWSSVRQKAKKLSKKLLDGMPKGRIGLDKESFFCHNAYHVTKNGNRWSVWVHCMEGTKDWWSKSHCEAENGYGTKSYFFLRGMNTPHQYYVEVSPHAIRRIRERYINPDKEATFANSVTHEVVDLGIFSRHDCGIFFKAGKMHGDVFKPFFDKDGNIPGVIFMKNAMFYARMTPLGNFIFKTFFFPEAKKGTPKYEFIMMLAGIYMTFNMPKGEDSTEKRAELLSSVWQVIPKMRKYIEHFDQVVIPLFP